jgi:hypothetical protein
VLETNKGRRAAFVEQMAQYTPRQLGFLDETSKDECTLSRGFGRSKKGRRAAKKQVFVQGTRVSTEALLSLDGIVAGTAVQGLMTKNIFYSYLALNVVSDTIIFAVEFFILQYLTATKMQRLSWSSKCPHHGQCKNPPQ